MLKLGSSARRFGAATLILSATLAMVAVGRAQEAKDAAPEASAAATAAPAPAAPEAPAPDPEALRAKTLGELQAPQKPALNRAIRDALTRAADANSRVNPQTHAQRQALDAYYANRGDAPIWLDKGEWTREARAAFQRLQHAPEDGLDLSAWRVFSLDRGPDASLALADVALSEAVAAYAFQASGGRLDPARISHLIGAHPTVVGPVQALDETARASDADHALQAYNPDQPGYVALREKLAQAREGGAPMALLASTETPRRASDAVGGRRRGGDRALESDILVNMEFWRWQPRQPGADRLVVNIPEFEARLFRADSEILSARVIVGKPDKPTPLFSNRMEYLVVNPSWNVPQSIIKNEMMNKLGALRRMGYDVETVNGRLRVRQPPGERNALGRIKFIFPNDYAVYLHDTPSRNLFSAPVRAFSHGCVRVDEPLTLAVALLRPERGWSEQRLEKMFGKSERRVNLPEPLPIHLVYFTLRADDSGELQRFDDIYGYAGKARQLLGLGG
jgi:murein L,D-transpeptidase YcbB/YkuD